MSFLKKFGVVLLEGLKIVTGIAPIIEASAPQTTAALTAVSSTFDRILQAVATVEAVGAALSLPGAQKAIAVAPLVEQELLALCKARGWQIADEAKFKAACLAIGGDVADLMNAVKPDAVQTTGL